jgi:transposase
MPFDSYPYVINQRVEGNIRGKPTEPGAFSYVRLNKCIPANHPLRLIRKVTDAALASLSRDFEAIYANEGRPSIPPGRLLRALLVQALYSVRSECQLCSK